MKKTCITLGCLLAAVGIALSWLGARMGGQTTASVNLFGRSWTVNAPFSGGGPALSIHTDSVSDPATSLAPGTAWATPVLEDRGQWTESYVTGVTDMSGTPFTSIDLDVDLGDVTITAGDNYEVDIYCDSSSYRVEHWYTDDVLHISGDSEDDLFPNQYGCDIIITVPYGAPLDDLWAELDLGDLTLAGLDIGYADLNLELGELVGEGLTVRGGLTAEADLGSVTLSGDLGELVEIDASLGNVDLMLSRPAADYNWQLTADLGTVSVNGSGQVSNRTVTGGNGDSSIFVDADLGSINVSFDQPVMREAQFTEEPASSIPVEDSGEVSYVTEEE